MMTDEIKEIICKDLAPRILDYLQVEYEGKVYNVEYIDLYYEIKLEGENYTLDIEEIKPILRPMSSMTEEEQVQYHNVFINPINKEWNVLDWLNKNNFDYRGILKYYE